MTRRKKRLLLLVGIAVLAGLAYAGLAGNGDRRTVLEASPDSLRKWGRHFIVGFDDFEEVEALAARGAVGGIFLRAGNVRGRTSAEIGTEIRKLQEIRRNAGLPPLLVAADQEGGPISRMSPPLPRLPPLAQILGEADIDAVEAVAEAYGELQGRGLARLGVNLNFSPVVDLASGEAALSLHTPIAARSLGVDAGVVERAARAYAAGLAKFGVASTWKHFPGLGRFTEDTHFREAVWDGPIAELEARDWIPFREASRRPRTAIMLGHVRLNELDPDNPASLSKTVIQDVIRERWGGDGVLVTDDVQMGPIRSRPGGAGRAAVDALNAGADLVLAANGLKPYYAGMRALMAAERESRMDEPMIAASARRLDRFLE